jgi:hypothetical protein
MRKLLVLGSLVAHATLAHAHDGVSHDPRLPAATQAQIHEVAAAVARYRDFRVAEREGWKKFGGDEPLMGEHWHSDRGPDYVSGDRIDFSRPSNLMYTDIGGKKVLTGVAFIVRLADGEPVPEGFAGTADHWHVHDFLRAVDAALVDRPVLKWVANWWLDANFRNKGDNRGRLAMAHAWVTLPNPDGVFADQNRTIPYLKLGLPIVYADGASLAAAQGLNLATSNGCRELIDGRLWIANVQGRTADHLRQRCAAEADIVRGAITAPPARLNAVAEAAWRRFDTEFAASLTPDQRARVAALAEHGGHNADMKRGRAGQEASPMHHH